MIFSARISYLVSALYSKVSFVTMPKPLLLLPVEAKIGEWVLRCECLGVQGQHSNLSCVIEGYLHLDVIDFTDSVSW